GYGIAAFTIHGGTPEGAMEYYEQFWIWGNLLRVTFLSNNRHQIYRLYVVRGFNKYILIGPVILLIAGTAFSSLAVWGQSATNPGATIQNFDIFTWGMVSFSMSCATNIIVTGLIGKRFF
ncbi:hypothetical protein GYMLUDRAFT_114707, partial [Collybiopsis luxurians FD-317 M1]